MSTVTRTSTNGKSRVSSTRKSLRKEAPELAPLVEADLGGRGGAAVVRAPSDRRARTLGRAEPFSLEALGSRWGLSTAEGDQRTGRSTRRSYASVVGVLVNAAHYDASREADRVSDVHDPEAASGAPCAGGVAVAGVKPGNGASHEDGTVKVESPSSSGSARQFFPDWFDLSEDEDQHP
ncbi:hypothetical protein FA95DRAFT_1567821 [Auriscalpium vulgare]|uniref:Uncharacterized protein n=1 Tax=Auriscalpium vulgare TaxID=40419 RepID=A0ACB8R2D9_9AGAM|nr:hypothetical protein FA95DRAFT_1567821 [Auriscalpium vulgare]